MLRITLDDYVLHALTERVPSNVHSGLSGLASSEDRVTSGNVAGDQGMYVTSTLQGGRNISMSGALRGDGGSFQTKRQDFIAATMNQRDTTGTVVPRLLKITDLDGRLYQLEVVRRNLDFDHETPAFANYLLQLLAPDPLIYSQTETTATVSLPTGGGFIVPAIVPIDFDSSSGGMATVTNAGNAITKPTIEFYGPLINPVIANDATGSRIGLNLTLVAGDVVVLNHKLRTAVQGGSTNRMGSVMSGVNWWGLVPGDNPIRLSSDSPDTGYAIVRSRSAWSGL